MYKKIGFIVLLAISLLGLTALAQVKPRVLNLYMFEEYISPNAVKAFEKKFAVQIKIQTYNNNEELIEVLKSKKTFDIVNPSQTYVKTMLSQKLIRTLDLKQIPNIKNLSLFDKTSQRAALPYFFGTTGLVYRKDKLSNFTNSWKLIFDENTKIGSFALLDDPRSMIGAALRYLNKDWNSENPKDLLAAQNVLLKAKKRSVGILDSVSATTLLRQGKIVIAFAYNTNVTLLDPPDARLDYVIPLEGSEIYYDMLAITGSSKQPQLAHQFINFMLEEKIAAENATWNGSATPNEAAQLLIKPAMRNNPLIYPRYDVLARLFVSQNLSPKAEKLYAKVWATVKKP